MKANVYRFYYDVPAENETKANEIFQADVDANGIEGIACIMAIEVIEKDIEIEEE